MNSRILYVPFGDDLLVRVADELLVNLPGSSPDHLADALVLLPSARACRTLGHHLLERSGGDALLLPRLLTDAQWSDEMAAGLGLDDAGLPDDRVRAVLLAHRLRGAPWLEGGDAAAPGLAEAFVAFFDEMRRYRVDHRVLEGDDSTPLLRLARPADAETVAAEVERIREVWGLYRDALPRDRLDRLVDTVKALEQGEGLPSPGPALVVVAGFGRIDPLRAALFRVALKHGADHRLLVPTSGCALDRLFNTTWGLSAKSSGPMAGADSLLECLEPIDPTTLPVGDRPLGERLADMVGDRKAVVNEGPQLLVAGSPEDEARAVAGRVAAWLADHGVPELGVTVATNDPRLAARITAQLRDAGLDADNTVGEALAALPAGLLLRFILRAALTDLRAEPLLEVLGHPYTRLAETPGKTGTWALRLERMFRRETGPQTGLAGLHRRARDRDAAALELFHRQAPGMGDFVARVADAFAPLLDLADGRACPWSQLLAALHEVWQALAPDRPLAEHRDQPDLTAAARLLEELRTDSDRLPPVNLAGFAADLGRLLAGESVVPHRPRSIPILVTGLVEARLARSDFLILAGLNDGVFPASSGTPVVLPGRVRRMMQLPTWRQARARDAELFLRLLHGAPEVLVTWSGRRDGQPSLPSPLVERLQLALGDREPVKDDGAVWRLAAPPLEVIAAEQAAFAAEPPAIGRHAEARPLVELSWTMLRNWRDCPYRALLERGYALRPDEEVRDEFGRREYGSVVHAVMCEALAADSPAFAALVQGDRPGAEAALAELARTHFLPGAVELPERRLWCDAFIRLVPEVVGIELDRFAAGRPVALESGFRLPLVELDAWYRDQGGDAPPLPAHAAAIVLKGVIDRVDRGTGGGVTVLDYKTGGVPTFKDLKEGEDLQLALYALAVELGAVEDCPGPVVGACFYGLSDKALGPVVPARGSHPLERTTDADDPLVPAARSLLDLALAAADPAGSFPLLPRQVGGRVEGELPCRWCDHRGVCRVEERVLTPAIAARLDKIVGGKEVAS